MKESTAGTESCRLNMASRVLQAMGGQGDKERGGERRQRDTEREKEMVNRPREL